MKIEAYSFGAMTVNGVIYRKDLIIFPDKVKPDWRRREGHTLALEDLGDVIAYGPEVLVIGKGAMGVMNVPDSTVEALKDKGIKLVQANSGRAHQIFNEEAAKDKKVVGAFHLTC